MHPPTISNSTVDAGRRACAQLVRAVSSTTLAPLQRAAAASALAQLHALLEKEGCVIITALESFEDVRTTVSTLVAVYLVALREVATMIASLAPGPCAAAEDQAQLKESKDITGPESPEPIPHSMASDAGADSCSAVSACGGPGGAHGAGSFPEYWVPLLVDSSKLVASCLSKGISIIAYPTADASVAEAEAKLHHAALLHACSKQTLASALLMCDALPALSRLLSAEAQRGPARALLTPHQLATCLQPLSVLIAVVGQCHDAPLPVSPQPLRQPNPPAPNSPMVTTATGANPAPPAVPPTPAPTCSTSTPRAAVSSDSPPAAAARLSVADVTCPGPPAAAGEPGGSAAAPVPQGQRPATTSTSPAAPSRQTLGHSLLCAVAESGVVEAAFRAAVGAVEQGAAGGQQQQQQHHYQQQQGPTCVAGDDRKLPLVHLLELQRQFDMLWNGEAAPLPQEPLRTILAGPGMQYALAAHSVSQLHAVDGGTTYGLPYDSLMPTAPGKGKAVLSCNGLLDAVYWWAQTCSSGSYELPPCGLPPRGLFELCLRTAEVAADCWRRRHFLPAAVEAAATAAAAGGSVGDSSGSSSSSGHTASGGGQHGQGEAALGAAGVEAGQLAVPCSPGSTGSAGGVSCGNPPTGDLPRAALEPSKCPELAIQAMTCSRELMESSCRAGAGAGSRPGAAATEECAPVLEGTCSRGCGDAAEEACSGSSGRDTTDDTGLWLCKGGPLARRWWRAAVAAVHCAMDQLVDSQAEARSVHGMLDPSLAMPVSDPGPVLPAAPPPALSAALDAGYLSCLERTLRTCFRSCKTLSNAMTMCGGVFAANGDAAWPLLLAFGDEREAVAFLATAAKVARRACAERARPGGDRRACAAVMDWLQGLYSGLWQAADHVAVRIAIERGLGEGHQSSVPVQEQGSEAAATGDGDVGGIGGSGHGGSGGCGGDSSGGHGGGEAPSDGGGDGGADDDVSTTDHSSISGGGSSTSDRRGDCGSVGGMDAGSGACDKEGGVRSSAGGSCDGGGGGQRGSGNNSCNNDGYGSGGSGSGGRSTGGTAGPHTSGASGCGTDAAATTAATNTASTAATTAAAAATAAAGSLSPPEQQLLRLLSFALPLWLPLWLDLVSAMVTDGRLTRLWHWDVHAALEMLDLVQHLCMYALWRKDLRAAESWRSAIGKSGKEVEGMLDGCRRLLEREEQAAGLLPAGGRSGISVREERGHIAEKLFSEMEQVRETDFVLDADLQEAMAAQGEVEDGWEGRWPLVGVGLLPPPCDARQVLPCCSNPRCADLAGDSEAGVVLRRCGGACGGAAAYCCAACQRAHWAAGHREECARKRSGGEVVGSEVRPGSQTGAVAVPPDRV